MRATFNYGVRKKLIANNPTEGLDFFPVEKKVKYVPSNEDIDKVIDVADSDTQDYLWAIRETMARVGEIILVERKYLRDENPGKRRGRTYSVNPHALA